MTPSNDAYVNHDEDKSHECPAAGCRVNVPNTMVFCRRHWFAVPKPFRDRIWQSFRDGNAGTVSHIELIKEAAEAIG